MNITEIEKAYIAGFFDGEGSIVIIKDNRAGKGKHRSPSYSLVSIISQKQPEVLHWIQNKIDLGSISTDKKGISSLRLSRKDTRILLEIIRPYLMVKDEQADLAIEFCDHMDEGSGLIGRSSVPENILAIREDYRYRLSKLKGSSGNRKKIESLL